MQAENHEVRAVVKERGIKPVTDAIRAPRRGSRLGLRNYATSPAARPK